MNARILYGNRQNFGIEFSFAKSKNYIHVQLWLGGQWVGDIQDSIMPEYMCASLLELACPKRYPRYAYDSKEDIPSYEDLLDNCGSFGESFDPFVLAYCSLTTREYVNFTWRLDEDYYYLFPDYPRQIFHRSVPLPTYNNVVRMFIMTMINDGYYVIRNGIPTLDDLDCF
ncbi:MAG: hypothetical protein R3B84_19905 [Zavarzinella sp.]